MNHKLRVLVRMDVDPAHVTLEITGCITQSDSATLMHIVRRACRLEAGAEVVIDLHGVSHLDPEVLLDLRQLVRSGPRPLPDGGDSTAALPCRLVLDEPTELPICLLHVGADGEVLQVAAAGEDFPGLDVVPDSGSGYGLEGPDSPLVAEPGGVLDLDSINGLALSEYFEGTLDPAATVRALSDTSLCQLADALYRHLDTSTPSFGAHTWYELAAEELQNRHLTGGDGPEEEDELSPDTAVA